MEVIDTMGEVSFLPPRDEVYRYPLKRYLPLYHPGVISSWLARNAEVDSVVLDLLGSNPLYTLEAANAGYRLFQSQKNPILRLITEVLAASPDEEDLHNALKEMLNQEWHGEKLCDHIRNLYLTDCRKCGEQVNAQGFVWNKGEETPASVVYICDECSDSGTYPVSESDLERFHSFGNIAIYRARAAQRCSIEGIDNEKHIAQTLQCYTKRALHVIVILFNALERLDSDPQVQRYARAILLETFDHASSLWHYPSKDSRPQQLSIPSMYFEKNIYQSLQQALKVWSSFACKCYTTTFPTIPDHSNSICMLDRAALGRVSHSSAIDFDHVFTVFPRPNQAFWTLSAIWSAWLFGKKEASGMLTALSRQRYGWYWFAQALGITFKSLEKIPPAMKKVFCMYSQYTPSYLLAAFQGLELAGVDFTSSTFPAEKRFIQIQAQHPNEKPIPDKNEHFSPRQTIAKYLNTTAEPASFQDLFTIMLTTLAQDHQLAGNAQELSSNYYNTIVTNLQNELTDTNFYRKFGSGSITSSLWSLSDLSHLHTPLHERVESEITERLYQERTIDSQKLYAQICTQFSGYLVPDLDLFKICLESYATRKDFTSHTYSLDEHEGSHKRELDLVVIQEKIKTIGENIGFHTQGDTPLNWLDTSGKILYQFFITTSSIFHPFLTSSLLDENASHVIVFPASRSRLIAYKLDRDPLLQWRLQNHWHLIKYRHIRKISSQEELTLQAWRDMLDADPPSWKAPQQLKML